MLQDLQTIWAVWGWIQSPEGVAIFAAAWALACEILRAIPSIQANSVFHAIYLILAKLANKTPAITLLLPVLLLAACSAVQIQKEQAIVAKIKADGKTLIVTGCKDLPAIEVLASIVPEFYPPAAAAVTVGDAFAERFCAKVKAAQAVTAPA